MEAQFNRKHGARFRSFNVGDQIFARHKKGEDWRTGKISERNGVIYAVNFTENSTGRFHANQLHARVIEDEDIPHPLDVLNDTFGLEPPPRRSTRTRASADDQSAPAQIRLCTDQGGKVINLKGEALGRHLNVIIFGILFISISVPHTIVYPH
ncbi:hypothetical protein niasHS_007968 [Heterodera schachtii]|uniref:Uncharacterized protein n=1 Tax=Heterodera schachtii TaxID=97005 RepID=A0ABD2JQ70_HETSC